MKRKLTKEAVELFTKSWRGFRSLEEKENEVIAEVSAGGYIGTCDESAKILANLTEKNVKYEFNGTWYTVHPYSLKTSRGFFLGKIADVEDEKKMELRQYQRRIQDLDETIQVYRKIQELFE